LRAMRVSEGGEPGLNYSLLPRYSGGEGSGVSAKSSRLLRAPTPHPQPLSPEYRGEGSSNRRLAGLRPFPNMKTMALEIAMIAALAILGIGAMIPVYWAW